MDGTLINSEPYWMAAEHELTRAYGVPWSDEQGLELVGKGLAQSAKLFQDLGVLLSIEEIIEFLISRVAAAVAEQVPWQPGAREVLAWLRTAGVPCALVTASYRTLADALVTRTPAGTFGAIVTGEEVTCGKPDPEPYLLAAERLGVDIADCLVLEDSHTGIASALASGAVAAAIEVMVPLPREPGLSRIKSLSSITPEFVDTLMSGIVVDHLEDRANHA